MESSRLNKSAHNRCQNLAKTLFYPYGDEVATPLETRLATFLLNFKKYLRQKFYGISAAPHQFRITNNMSLVYSIIII